MCMKKVPLRLGLGHFSKHGPIDSGMLKRGDLYQEFIVLHYMHIMLHCWRTVLWCTAITHLPSGMPLVIMESPLHAHHWVAWDVSKHQVTLVTFHCIKMTFASCCLMSQQNSCKTRLTTHLMHRPQLSIGTIVYIHVCTTVIAWRSLQYENKDYG